MRECVKNWEDTTPGTVRGKPAHSQLQHSLHPRKLGGWARRSDSKQESVRKSPAAHDGSPFPPMDRTVYRYIQMRDLNHEIH